MKNLKKTFRIDIKKTFMSGYLMTRSYACTLLWVVLTSMLCFNIELSTAGMQGSYFVENVGQVKLGKHPRPGSALFYMNEQSHSQAFYLNQYGFTFVFSEYEIEYKERFGVEIPEIVNNKTEGIELFFVDYSPDVNITGVGKRDYFERYYLPEIDGEIAHTYDAVKYEGLYEGIDLKVYPKDGGFKYDFIVSPGADPGKIKMEYRGQESLRLIDGALIAEVSKGEVREEAPYTYYLNENNERVTVPSAFVLDQDNFVSFEIGNYPLEKELLIDPMVTYSSYFSRNIFYCGEPLLFSCSDSDPKKRTEGIDLSVLNDGKVVLTGWADRRVWEFANGGTHLDIRNFATKINENGTAIWTTYFGGSDIETPSAMDHFMDDQDNEWLAIGGWTSSYNFPKAKNNFNGEFDGYILVMDTDGAIHHCAFVGGEQEDEVTDIKWQKGGDEIFISISGATNSEEFFGQTIDSDPNNGFQTDLKSNDGFLAVVEFSVNIDGEGVIGDYDYFTYFGEEELYARINGIDVFSIDNDRFISVAGNFRYLDDPFPPYPSIPLTDDAFQDDLNYIGLYGFNAFFSVFNIDDENSNNQLFYSTYLSGTDVDGAVDVSYNQERNDFIVVGHTSSTDFTEEGNTPDFKNNHASHGGGFSQDGFFVQFDFENQTEIVYQWTRFHGGTAADKVWKVDNTDIGIYAFGTTQSADFPISHALEGSENINGNRDLFLSIISLDGEDVIFSTYFGGGGEEESGGMYVDACNEIWFTGSSTSDDDDNSPDYPLVNADLNQSNKVPIGVISNITLDLSERKPVIIANGDKLPEVDKLELDKFTQHYFNDYKWYKDGIQISDSYDGWYETGVSLDPRELGSGEYYVVANRIVCNEEEDVISEKLTLVWDCEGGLSESPYEFLHSFESEDLKYNWITSNNGDGPFIINDPAIVHEIPDGHWIVHDDIVIGSGPGGNEVVLSLMSNSPDEQSSLLMQECSEIKVAENGRLEIDNYKIEGCDTWMGINAAAIDDGVINVKNAEIRDAYIGIYAYSSDQLELVNNSIFGYNYAHIVVFNDDGNAGTNHLYEISESLFDPLRIANIDDEEPQECGTYPKDDFLDVMVYIADQRGGLFYENTFNSLPSVLTGTKEITAFYGENLATGGTQPPEFTENVFTGRFNKGYEIVSSDNVEWYLDEFKSEEDPVDYPYFIYGSEDILINGSEIKSQLIAGIFMENGKESTIDGVTVTLGNWNVASKGIYILNFENKQVIKESSIIIDCDAIDESYGIYFKDASPYISEIEISTSSILLSETSYNSYGIYMDNPTIVNLFDLNIDVLGNGVSVGMYGKTFSEINITNIELFLNGSGDTYGAMFDGGAKVNIDNISNLFTDVVVDGTGKNIGYYFYGVDYDLINTTFEVNGNGSSYGIYHEFSTANIEAIEFNINGNGNSYGAYFEGPIFYNKEVDLDDIIINLSGNDNNYGIYLNNIDECEINNTVVNMNYGYGDRYFGIKGKENVNNCVISSFEAVSHFAKPVVDWDQSTITDEYWTTGIYFKNSTEVLIENSNFDNLVNGIEFYRSDYQGLGHPDIVTDFETISHITNNLFTNNTFGIVVSESEHPSLDENQNTIIDLAIFCNMFCENNIGVFGYGELMNHFISSYTGPDLKLSPYNHFSFNNGNSSNFDWDILWSGSSLDYYYSELTTGNIKSFTEPESLNMNYNSYWLNGSLKSTSDINIDEEDHAILYYDCWEDWYGGAPDCGSNKRSIYSNLQKSDSENEVLIFPNPYTQSFTVILPAMFESGGRISLKNLQGQILLSDMWKSTTDIVIETPGLEIGAYILLLETETGESYKQLIIHH